MKLVSLGVYWLVSIILGMGILACFQENEKTSYWVERFSLAGCLGPGLIFLLSLFTFNLSSLSLLPLFSALGLVPWLCIRFPLFSKKIVSNSDSRSSLIKGILFCICLQVVFLFASSLWRPVTLHDDYIHWAGNAKYLFYHGKIDTSFFSGNTHSNYPLFIAMNEVFLCKIYGKWDDFLCKSFLIPFFVSFLGCVYCFLKSRTSKLTALTGVFIFVSLPIYVRTGISGTGEIPLSLNLGLATIFLLEFFEKPALKNSLFFGFFSGMAIATKSEGLFAIFGFLIPVIFWTFKKNRIPAKLGYALLLMTLFHLPWVWLMKTGECQQSRLEDISFFWLISFDAYKDFFETIISKLVPSSTLSILGLFFLGCLGIFFCKNRKHTPSLLILQLIGSIAFIYLVGSYVTDWRDQYGRLLNHLIPMIVLFIAFQMHAFFKEDSTIRP